MYPIGSGSKDASNNCFQAAAGSRAADLHVVGHKVKTLFTIHAGEFVVCDYVVRALSEERTHPSDSREMLWKYSVR